MKKTKDKLGLNLVIGATTILVILFLSYIISFTKVDALSKIVKMNLDSATICREEDNHGGFVGDGYSFIEIALSEEQNADLKKEISELKGWNKLPYTDLMERLVRIYVNDSEDMELFPKIEEGYYFFYDRQEREDNWLLELLSRRDKYQLDVEFYEQNSHNFTVALYDTVNGKLYYYEYDS